jgi:hypothetical protein
MRMGKSNYSFLIFVQRGDCAHPCWSSSKQRIFQGYFTHSEIGEIALSTFPSHSIGSTSAIPRTGLQRHRGNAASAKAAGLDARQAKK